MKYLLLMILTSVSSAQAGFVCMGVQDPNFILSVGPASYQASPPRYVLELWNAQKDQLVDRTFGWVRPSFFRANEFEAVDLALSPSEPTNGGAGDIYLLKPNRATSPSIEFRCYGELGR